MDSDDQILVHSVYSPHSVGFLVVATSDKDSGYSVRLA